MGAFSDFLEAKKLTEEQILRRSKRLESLRSEDRALHRRREAHRRSGAKTSYEEAGIAKPRSGRSLQREHVRAAMNDKPIPGPVRTKMLRAISSLLGKDAGPIDVTTVFGSVPSKQGKKPR